VAAPLRVVLDANVLYPSMVRGILFRLAAAGFFLVYWSDDILDETTRNLEASAGMTSAQSGRLREAMERAFPEAMVSGYGRLIASMPNDPKDRHVAAAAVKAQAQVIVTNNLKDFAKLPTGLRAQSADEFLLEVFRLDPDAVISELRAQAAALQKPPVTFERLLGGLARLLPKFIGAVRAL
jgi:predicted nucleic acid-binding protein